MTDEHRHLHIEETDLSPLPIPIRAFLTLGPFIAFAVLLTLSYLLHGSGAINLILTVVVGSFAGLGKFVVFFGLPDKSAFGPFMAAGLVVFGDVSTALIMISNVHYFYKIPKLGAHLQRVQRSGHDVLRVHKWMRRVSWLGLAIFVAVPFQGTGAVLGVFLGRILGLSRTAIVTAIASGSIAGAFALAWLARTIGKHQQEQIQQISNDPLLVVAIVGGVLVVTYFLGKWFLGDVKRHPEDHPDFRP